MIFCILFFNLLKNNIRKLYLIVKIINKKKREKKIINNFPFLITTYNFFFHKASTPAQKHAHFQFFPLMSSISGCSLDSLQLQDPNFHSLNNSLSPLPPSSLKQVHSLSHISLREDESHHSRNRSFTISADMQEKGGHEKAGFNIFATISKRRSGKNMEKNGELASLFEKKSISELEKPKGEGASSSSSESGNDGEEEGSYSYSSSSSRFSVVEGEKVKVELFQIDEKYAFTFEFFKFFCLVEERRKTQFIRFYSMRRSLKW